MKKFYYLISFLLCLSGAVMISCGDDDDDVTTGGSGSSSGGSGSSTKTQVINGHEYVDLGLSVLWAKSNIGAHESISGEYSRMNEKNDQGSLFAWGETVEKENFTWGNYKYCTGSDWSTCQYLGDVLPADKDVVQKEWGGGWRMPTYEEAKELVSKCTIKAYAPTIVGSEANNAYFEVKGPNGNVIYIPSMFLYTYNKEAGEADFNGDYAATLWTSSYNREVLDSKGKLSVELAEALFLGYYKYDAAHYVYGTVANPRREGNPVRPVIDKKYAK